MESPYPRNNIIWNSLKSHIYLGMRLSSSYLIWYGNWLQSAQYKHLLDDIDKRNRDCRIPRIALKKYAFSAFRHLYLSGNEQALLNCTGSDYLSFQNFFVIDTNKIVCR